MSRGCPEFDLDVAKGLARVGVGLEEGVGLEVAVGSAIPFGSELEVVSDSGF